MVGFFLFGGIFFHSPVQTIAASYNKEMMGRISLILLACLFAFVLPEKGFSQSNFVNFNDAVFPEIITSGRALAMGNAYINKVDDSAAAFYNPAGLGTVRYPHLHLSNIHVEANKGWMDLAAGGSFTDAAGNFTDALSLDGVRKLLVDRPGNLSHTRYHFMPNFTARFISFGYLYSKRVKAYLGPEDTDQFEFAYRQDHGPYGALNLSVFGGVLKFGITGAFIRRKELTGSQDRNTSAEFESAAYRKGNAFLATSGVRLTLPITFLPTFSYVSHNAFGGDFSTSGSGKPETPKTSHDIGFSLTPQVGKKVRIHFEVNYKDASGEYSDVDEKRKVLAGMEIDVARTFFIRAGYGDSYGTFGLGIRSRRLEFDLTTYAVDTTDETYRGSEDRRFAFTLSSGF